MSWRDPKFKYTPVSKQGVGYLARKFARIRAEAKEREQAAPVKVLPIKRAAK